MASNVPATPMSGVATHVLALLRSRYSRCDVAAILRTQSQSLRVLMLLAQCQVQSRVNT